MALNARQQAFVDCYAGNATDAARKAGYTGTDDAIRVTASRLLAKPNIAAAIKARQEVPRARRIATREDRQAFWTETLLDKTQRMADRLKAAELLGRSEADFTEKLIVKGELTLAQLVEQATTKGPAK